MPKYKHGSGSVYKRGKVWWVTYYANGKQIWESAKTKNRAEARSKLNERLGEVAKGEFIGPAAERVTFQDLAEMILTDYKVNGKKSIGDVELRVEKHLAPSSVAARPTTSPRRRYKPTSPAGRKKRQRGARSIAN